MNDLALVARCSIPDCDLPFKSRGMCSPHYMRWYRYGDPLRGGAMRLPGTTLERFQARIEKGATSDGCWTWTGTISGGGYGHCWTGERVGLAHRFAYELWVGQIPEGLQIDHTCHNVAATRGECAGGTSCLHRRCVNPTHLEAVTHEVNSLRSVTNPTAANAAKTHCPKGHEYTPENTYVYPNRRSRLCRRCRADRMARYKVERGAR